MLRGRSSGAELASSADIPGGRLAGYTRGGRGLLVATGSGSSVILDARTLKRVRAFPVGGAAALSPTGDAAAFGHADGSLTLLDLRTGSTRRFTGRADARIDAVAFAPDGAVLATTTENGTVTTWSVRTGELRDTFTGHSGASIAAVFSPDGRTLYTASSDGTVIAWDAGGARRLGRPFRYARQDDASSASAVAPDGSVVAVSRVPNRVDLLDARTLTATGRTLTGPLGTVHGIAFSRDGALVAGRETRTRPSGTSGRARGRGPSASGRTAPTTSPSARTAASWPSRRPTTRSRLVSLRTGATRDLPSKGSPGDVDFSPDGKLLASASLNGTVTLWDVAAKSTVRSLSGPVAAYSVAFSPDGKLVAVGDNSGTVVLWDPARGARVGSPLIAHNGGVSSLAFSPDGRALATAGFDGNVGLWNVSARKLIGGPLPSGPSAGSVSFFPDGKQLLGTLGSGTGTLWNVDPRAWEARACGVAGRQLTRTEWADFLGGRAYADVCPTRASRR